MTWGAHDLTVRFGSRTALDRVDIDVTPGEIVAVVGGDGAGKTTLLRVLAGVGLPLEGTIRIPEPRRIGYVPPNGGVFSDLSVDENMEFVADAYGLDEWRARAAELLQRFGISRFGDRLAGQLSGGQRRKLAGSMALLPAPSLLVLDEVTTGVDPVSRMDLWRLVAGAAATGSAVVLATTYLDEAERAATALLLHRGRVLASGTPDSIIAAVPGTVTGREAPPNTGHAWRRGRRWRVWDPQGTESDEPVSLEDAAIVAELQLRGTS